MKRFAGVSVFCGNNVLLAKRIYFYRGEPVTLGGYWSIFAGLVEKGETLKAAAERELFEETQIQLEKPLIRIGKINQLTIYAAEIDDIIYPTLNFEHTESGWFDISLLPHFPYKIDNEMVNLLLKYKKNV